jgi:hypothetical protein
VKKLVPVCLHYQNIRSILLSYPPALYTCTVPCKKIFIHLLKNIFTMKKIKLHAMAFMAGLFFLASCNSGETKTEETTGGDTSTKKEEAPPPPAAPAKPANVALIWHKVANYAKWLTDYESHDSARLANGLHNYIIGRGLDKDSNMVMVALKMDDAEKAKQFGASADLKAAMKKAGVTGTPKMSYLDVQMLDASNNADIRVMRMAKVKDYDVWKKAFDSNKQIRTDAGLSDRALGFSVGDNHNVTIVYTVADKKKAEEHFASPGLKERMKTAGVEGTPETFWYSVAKRY